MPSWVHRQPTLLPGHATAAEHVYIARATASGVFATMSIALYALYVVRDAHLTPFQLVIVGAVLEGSTFLFEVPTGVVADVVSRRFSILIGTVLFGLGPVCFGLFPSFAGIVAGQLFFGIGYTFFSGAQEAWLADEIGEDAAARVYPRAAQWRQAAAIFGTLAGSALGLLDHRAPFIVGGAAYSLIALPLALTMPERGFRPVRNVEAPRGVWPSLAGTVRSAVTAVTGSTPVRVAFLVTFFAGASSEAFDRLWSYHLLHNIGIPQGMNEVLLFGAIGLLGQVGGFMLVRLARNAIADVDRNSLSRLLAVLYALIAGAIVVFALSRGFWLALPALLLVEWARRAEAPFFVGWVNRNLDPATRATVLSSISQGNALGQLGGGPLFAVIAGAGSATVALLLGAALVAPSALLVRLRSANGRGDR